MASTHLLGYWMTWLKIELDDSQCYYKDISNFEFYCWNKPGKYIFHRHNRRPIDLSVTFRLSGLVNRATVDLVTLTPDDCRRVCESPNKVRVCLRLENGERAVWEGDPNCPFWTILKETSSTNQQWVQVLIVFSPSKVYNPYPKYAP